MFGDASFAGKKLVMGFDGFVDTLVRVVQDRSAAGLARHFRHIDTFGQYISSKKGSGFSLETETQQQKLGGNMPITAHAMATLGFRVDCIGAMGYPAIHPAFTNMHANCRLHSFEEPGTTMALEFGDGKMMLCEMQQLNRADWALVKERIGLEKIRELISGADLLCLLNWSELDGSTGFWEGLFADVFPYIEIPKQIFIDLSDCSGRSAEALHELLLLIKNLNERSPVTLSLNHNEAGIISGLFTGNKKADLNELFLDLKIKRLVLHGSHGSEAVSSSETAQHKPAFIENPVIKTGAGDHFNAGFCAAMLAGASLYNCLRMGDTLAGIYMQKGHSPGRGFLEENLAR